MKKSDVLFCVKIEGMNYTLCDSSQVRKELLAMFQNKALCPTYYVYEENKEILGFAGFVNSWMDYSVYEIFWVNVHPKHQKKGIGKALMNHLIEELKKKKYHASLILGSASLKRNLPIYYRKNFGIKRLANIDKDNILMGLELER